LRVIVGVTEGDQPLHRQFSGMAPADKDPNAHQDQNKRTVVLHHDQYRRIWREKFGYNLAIPIRAATIHGQKMLEPSVRKRRMSSESTCGPNNGSRERTPRSFCASV
jgi:hypothetical protein